MITDDASWIEPFEPEIRPAGLRPGYALRRDFDCADLGCTGSGSTEIDRTGIRSGRVEITAHGIYELFVNGHRVGDQELTPGFTSYRTRLQVQSFDVTDLLVPGANTLGILLTDGWFRGRHGFEREADGFGTRTAALAELELVHADGGTGRLGTDHRWTSSTSHILAADLMDGQHSDLRLVDDWAVPGFDASSWHPVVVATGGLYGDRSRLVGPVGPPVRRVRDVGPKTLTVLASGAVVVDFGENLNGWVRLENLGPAGTRLTLTHGEVLAADRAVSTRNLRAFDFVSRVPLPAGQVDTVVSSGRPGDVFEPRHTTHGFRYLQVDGHPGDLTTDQVTAVVVHSALEPTGGFECSDTRINLLHAAGVRTFLANACDIPTDCPQRERSGFTGDWQVYVDAAAFTHDVAGFSDKWLRDLAADQWHNGVVPTIVPNPHGNGPTGMHFTDMTNGSAGWGDAAVIVPWKTWRQYGDRELLERQYPSMVAWVEYAANCAATARHPDRVAAWPEPREHEKYLWDTGFHFGEWLEPGIEPSLDPSRDNNEVATAYLSYSARLLAGVAALLGHGHDAARYAGISNRARHAWQVEQLSPDGRLLVQTQASHVRALAFELLPAELVQPVADRLAALVLDAGDHLATGFLSTGLLLPALAEHGHLDTAYRVLFSTGYPSWLGMIDHGATTIWERWDGLSESGVATGSLNHYSKGAVLEFLHCYIAGIRPAPQATEATVGYREFRIAPKPGGGITSANAFHDTPYGRIESNWRIEAGVFTLRVAVPAGTTAVVELPGGAVHRCGPGTHEWQDGSL